MITTPKYFHGTTHTENKAKQAKKKKKKIAHMYQGEKQTSEVNLVQIFMSPIK